MRMAEGSVLFQSHAPLGRGWPGGTLYFRRPRRVLVARRTEEVRPLLNEVEGAARQGAWAGLLLAYEAAPAFDSALRAHPCEGFPLAWAALYDELEPRQPPLAGGGFFPGPWRAEVDRPAYGRALGVIREQLRAGESYQVNYAMPFACDFQGDPVAWFLDTALRQGAGFQACAHLGKRMVLSFSPELFFLRRGDRVEARPMKGTMARGRWLEEDEARQGELRASPKDRAENVMIVDLARSDLGRVAVPGSVRVERMFEVEAYPTVLQLTSTVSAQVAPQTTLFELFQALFPCGSVTGAPKARTMGIIRDLEPGPRTAYCGALGYLAPGGDCAFNVPIRTAVLDLGSGRARFWVGGGVTHDSTAQGEYEECGVKMRFLTDKGREFRLMEALLLEQGAYFLLDEHLRRLAASARYFAFALDRDRVRGVLDSLALEKGQGRFKVRLLLERGGDLEAEALDLSAAWRALVRVAVAREPVCSSEALLFHKTTRRGFYAGVKAARPDCDDVILVNEQGEITESTSSNIVVRLEGSLWTPARRCGLLAGAFREHLLARGVIRERVIPLEEFLGAKNKWLINSVRRWRRIRSVEP